MIELLYPVWNRVEFTRFSWRCLVENTDWSLVSKVVIYDDGSTDGADKWIDRHRHQCPVETEYRYLGLRSPVATMNDYLAHTTIDVFAKIDNDIAVPPGWLNVMHDTLAANPGIELLGMEAGRTPSVPLDHRPYYVTEASHIGGVGLMRTWTFKKRTRMLANGRFGFTEWQHEHTPRRGWITPDLPVCSLDRIPFWPWTKFSKKYVANEWQRDWTTYWPDSGYWDWWPADVLQEMRPE